MKCRAITCKKQTGRVNGLCDDHYLMTTIFGENSLKKEIMKAEFIKANGSVVYFEKDTPFTYEELQDFVGGYVEICPTNDGRLMIMDDEGNLKKKPVNNLATNLIVFPSSKSSYHDHPCIVGDVVVCEKGLVEY